MSSSVPQGSVADSRTSSSVLDLIGRTPLVRLRRFERETPGVELYAKAEWQNPGGSVKDRAAARMILDGELSGPLPPGAHDPRRDIRQHRHCVRDGRRRPGIQGQAVPAGERQPRAEADPARVRRRARADEPARRRPTAPFGKRAGCTRRIPIAISIRISTTTTGTGGRTTTRPAPEIIEQTSGRLTHFVAGLGTSGTFVGTGRALRKFNPAIKLISFQPDSPFHGLEGLKHMASAIVPGIYDPSLADEDLRISTEDAHRMVRRLARKRGCWSASRRARRWRPRSRSPGGLRARRRRDRVSRTARRSICPRRSGRPMSDGG